MKLQGKENINKGNVNKRIIRWMLMIVVLICAAVILGYGFIAYQDAVNRAVASLHRYKDDQNYYLNNPEELPFVFEMAVYSEPENYLDEEERLMQEYYLQHADQLENGSIYQYSGSGLVTVYMPMPDYVWAREYLEPEVLNRDRKAVLLYCTITYTVRSLLNNMLVFSSVVAAVLVLLFIVSRAAVNRLNRKDEEMKHFFANASHELKTPLMSIRGNVDGLRNGYVDTEQGYEVIEKEVDRMSALITDILDISRLDSGSIKPEMLEADVREIVYDAVSSLLPQAEKNGIRMEVDLPEPVFRECDEAMMYSAFSNIISNAVRYADSNIWIKYRPASDRSDKADFIFENDGTPISEEDRKHIFDRFYKGAGGQSGIGMALAQEYVKLHGSEIGVGVENGHTVFSVPV